MDFDADLPASLSKRIKAEKRPGLTLQYSQLIGSDIKVLATTPIDREALPLRVGRQTFQNLIPLNQRQPSVETSINLVSRTHCFVSLTDDDEITLQDESSHGTWYNGRVLKKEKVIISSGDQFFLDNSPPRQLLVRVILETPDQEASESQKDEPAVNKASADDGSTSSTAQSKADKSKQKTGKEEQQKKKKQRKLLELPDGGRIDEYPDSDWEYDDDRKKKKRLPRKVADSASAESSELLASSSSSEKPKPKRKSKKRKSSDAGSEDDEEPKRPPKVKRRPAPDSEDDNDFAVEISDEEDDEKPFLTVHRVTRVRGRSTAEATAPAKPPEKAKAKEETRAKKSDEKKRENGTEKEKKSKNAPKEESKSKKSNEKPAPPKKMKKLRRKISIEESSEESDEPKTKPAKTNPPPAPSDAPVPTPAPAKASTPALTPAKASTPAPAPTKAPTPTPAPVKASAPAPAPPAAKPPSLASTAAPTSTLSATPVAEPTKRPQTTPPKATLPASVPETAPAPAAAISLVVSGAPPPPIQPIPLFNPEELRRWMRGLTFCWVGQPTDPLDDTEKKELVSHWEQDGVKYLPIIPDDGRVDLVVVRKNGLLTYPDRITNFEASKYDLSNRFVGTTADIKNLLAQKQLLNRIEIFPPIKGGYVVVDMSAFWDLPVICNTIRSDPEKPWKVFFKYRLLEDADTTFKQNFVKLSTQIQTEDLDHVVNQAESAKYPNLNPAILKLLTLQAESAKEARFFIFVSKHEADITKAKDLQLTATAPIGLQRIMQKITDNRRVPSLSKFGPDGMPKLR